MDGDRGDRFAQVAVMAQLGRAGGLYTYAVPESLTPLIGPGSLVRVPFTKRQLQGIVCALEPSTNLPRVRDIEEILDPVPVITIHGLEFARWIASHYASPLSDVLGAMVPPGLGRDTVYILELGPVRARERLTSEAHQVLDVVEEAGRISEHDLQRRLPRVDAQRVVRSLASRKLLVKLSELAPPRIAARSVRVVSLTDVGAHELKSGDTLRRARRQREVLELVAARSPVTSDVLRQIASGAAGAISALAARGMVTIEERVQARSPIDARHITATQSLHLSGAQLTAYEAVGESIRGMRHEVYLLHGVTGSGKTEVYLQAIADTIRLGRQAIMMVPEISLTPQAVDRVAGRFPGKVAVLHSKLSAGERVDEWQRIRHGEADVVVGPRSAIFAALPRPGLIVVDEEHDPSYKQDASPRYNARDAAAILGRLTNATVLLGSATPDVVTYTAARAGRISLLELPNRPVWGDSGQVSRPMPHVEVVDLRQELKAGNRSIFSARLQQGLDRTLREKHQALLFLNRRGSATVVLCRDCGFVVRCPNCDIPFTYHTATTRLICHRCDMRRVNPSECPACRSSRIRYLGIGTQRVEEEVRTLFPSARVLRWDRDVTGGKDAHDRILRVFARHEADILVGTQMIAKGLDFPLVTLVGVISADTGLHMPDFRAPERSFQLLTQVAGRAGRASLPSEVIVQTYTPEHYAIESARRHDYHSFYRDEIHFRKSACYPPFARLIRLVYSSELESQCRQSADNLRAILTRAIEDDRAADAEIIGPAPCFTARARNRYFWQIIVRARGARAGDELHALLDYVPAGWTIDVDPVDLL